MTTFDTANEKPKVYLAGPIFGQSDHGAYSWRAILKADDAFCWKDPMDRDFRGREDEVFRELVEGDKQDIDDCQAVVAKVDPVSAGTSMEILWAWLNETPVIVICTGKVSPWIRYHATDICGSEGKALQKLKELFA